MRRLILTFAFLASFASAQVPSDTLRTRLYQRLTTYRQFLAAHPGATVNRRLESMIEFVENGLHTAVLGRNMAYVDPDTRDITPLNLDLHQTDAGWRTVGSPVTIRVIDGPTFQGGATSEVDTYYKSPTDGTVVGYGIVVRPVSYSQDLSFRFTQQNIPWQIDLAEFGWDLKARVASTQGAKTYQFGFREVGMMLAPAANGDLALSNGKYRITRAQMIRADGIVAPCSNWARGASLISFTCDDTAFPPSAYPYVIDPTATYNVSPASGDIAVYQSYDSTYSYPGASSYFQVDFDSTYSYYHHAYLRVDTSGLPDNATISSASLHVQTRSSGTGGNGSVDVSGWRVPPTPLNPVLRDRLGWP
jgi:hypothetical protein